MFSLDIMGEKFHENDNAALGGGTEKTMQSQSLEAFRRKISIILNFKLVKICIEFHSISKNLILCWFKICSFTSS